MSEVSAPSMLSPKVLIPFMLTGTIWGSTWFVITGQISGVPAAWGVFFRFMLATPALFALAVVMGNRLKLNRPEHLLALGVGIAQFSGNFLFVYHSEQHITSGIVAVMFALLMVPNAVFAKIFIGERVASGFIGGSLVAIAGVAMLLVHEWNAAPLGGNVGLGIVLAVGGMLAASIANVVQANPTGRGVPMVSLLSWAMLYGTAFDLVYAFSVFTHLSESTARTALATLRRAVSDRVYPNLTARLRHLIEVNIVKDSRPIKEIEYFRILTKNMYSSRISSHICAV
mgnify:CR=1 FL=1